jgi:hypothetical protein
MDILYYSNYCKHCQKILQYIAKNGLIEKVTCISVDKRTLDPKTQQTMILLENGRPSPLPPNINRVPSMILVNRKYQVITGDEIVAYLQERFQIQSDKGSVRNAVAEPSGFSLQHSAPGGVNIVSEPYTFYNMTPDELSAKGRGGNRQMYNYVSANHDPLAIPTPPDNYRPDKISQTGITMEDLQKKRNEDVPQTQGAYLS